MYLAHFRLQEPPFGLTPDTAFAFSTRTHQEALNTVLIAIHSGEGFIKISGEVGTGKTLLCRRLLGTLGGQYVSCYLPNPHVTPRTLLLALANELGLGLPDDTTEYRLLKAVETKLLALAVDDKRVVVCLDEAQALSTKCLETVRLLSNLETEKRKLLQVVLFGQPELDERLAMTNLRQLRQRISFHYRLGTIAREELRRYLEHRLRVAGHWSGELFTAPAVAALHRASGGVPRVINILANKALLTAFGTGAAAVERGHVREAANDSRGPARFGFGWLRGFMR